MGWFRRVRLRLTARSSLLRATSTSWLIFWCVGPHLWQGPAHHFEVVTIPWPLLLGGSGFPPAGLSDPRRCSGAEVTSQLGATGRGSFLPRVLCGVAMVVLFTFSTSDTALRPVRARSPAAGFDCLLDGQAALKVQHVPSSLRGFQRLLPARQMKLSPDRSLKIFL